MRLPPVAVIFFVVGFSLPAEAQGEPLVLVEEPEDDPVEIVKDPPPPPPPLPWLPPPPPPTPPVDHAQWLVAGSAAPLGLVVTGADAGDYEATTIGASFFSSVGKILYLPEDSAFLADFRWQYDMVEVPLAIYRATLDASAGVRANFGRHALYAKGGANGSGGAALKWWKAEIRFPSVGVGYLWHAKDQLIQVGPEAALAMAGAFRVGKAAQIALDEDDTKDYHGVSYTFRPFTAGRADLIFPPVALSVSGGRTWLAGGEDGERLDEVTSTLCAEILDASGLPIGGCLFANVLWGDMRREEPERGELTAGAGWYVGASLLFAKVGELKF